MTQAPLREWQRTALQCWLASGNRGIVSVVTGGGKTFFALSCILAIGPRTTLIVVPSTALLDQWIDETASFFGLDATRDLNVISARHGVRPGAINLAVLNTAARLAPEHDPGEPVFLIVDECHKAATPKFGAALRFPKSASLGLSATPERQYDSGLINILVPELGPVIFEYSYRDALRDGVIVPFALHNIVFELARAEKEQYDKLTKSIRRSIARFGEESTEAISLLLRRTRVLNMSLERVRLALRLVARHRDQTVLVFHEDVGACNLIHSIALENKIECTVYHSGLARRTRLRALADYRGGHARVLVTCRALDEGFNVPQTEVGIIAAATATRRQRIQRLGRVLRPAVGKDAALIYTLVASTPEIARLRQEEQDMQGVAEVTWGRA